MKKTSIICILLVLFMLFVTACSTPTPTNATTAPAITASATAAVSASASASSSPAGKAYIGVAGFFTGTQQGQGAQTQKGVTVALKMINSEGGVLGNQVEPVYFDCVDSVQTTVSAVKLALEDTRIPLLCLDTNSTYTAAVMDYVKAAGMPMITSGSGDSIAAAKNPYVWQNRTLNSYVAIAMANYAFQKLGAKKPAIWTANLESQIAVKDQLIAQLKVLGIDVPDSMVFTSQDTETNYAPVVAQIKASGADCLMVCGTPQGIANLAKGIGDAGGLGIPVIGNATVATSVVVQNAGTAIEGWYCTADYVPSDTRNIVQKYITAYKADYGAVPDSASCVLFDMCYLYKAACEAAGSTTDRELINKAMSTIKGLDLVLGNYTVYDDHTMQNSITIAQMKGGTPQFVTSIQYR